MFTLFIFINYYTLLYNTIYNGSWQCCIFLHRKQITQCSSHLQERQRQAPYSISHCLNRNKQYNCTLAQQCTGWLLYIARTTRLCISANGRLFFNSTCIITCTDMCMLFMKGQNDSTMQEVIHFLTLIIKIIS